MDLYWAKIEFKGALTLTYHLLNFMTQETQIYDIFEVKLNIWLGTVCA